MRRLFCAVLLLAATIALAQTPGVSPVTQLTTISAAGVQTGSWQGLLGTGVQYHKMTWFVVGTITPPCVVKIEQTADSSVTAPVVTDLISSNWDCTADGGGNVTLTNAIVNNVRVNTVGFAGSGTLYVRYTGYVDMPQAVGGNGLTTPANARVNVSSDNTPFSVFSILKAPLPRQPCNAVRVSQCDK